MKFPPLNNSVAAAVRDAVMFFNGGLDQETPAWKVKPGHVRESNNYEQSIEGGYQDVTGYERFDGQTAPSTAAYSVMDVTISGSITVGDTLTGATSGATGVVVAVVTTTTPDYVVMTKVTGTFQSGENLEVSASVEAVAASVASVDGATTTVLHAQYTNLAADAYRADIAAVPGQGAILGVRQLNGVVYAFRNAVGGATAALYKQTSGGWSLVDLGLQVSFTGGGAAEISEGDVITGATSGATATVRRVGHVSGTWAGDDEVGYLILSGQTGTFAAENLNTPTQSNIATIAADSAAITLLPGGAYEFYNSNYADSQGNQRIYGCDGVNPGFEFDGTYFAPVRTGMTVDVPTHVIVHKQHLFFSFKSSVQHGGIGTPFNWTLRAGATELVTDGTITGFKREPGSQGNGALLICNRNRLHILYGTSTTDWELISFRDEVGAFPGTIQQVGSTMFLDDRGITMLRTAQEFGNFQHSTLSTKIQTLINGSRGLVLSSCIVRNKNQYRLFFSDNTALYVTMAGAKVAAIMPCTTGHQVTCIDSQETSNGTEEIYFGSTDGFVYQMEKGTSFDGDEINAYLRLHYTNDRVRSLKTFMHSVTIEAQGTGYAEIDFGYELGYGSEDIIQASDTNREIEFSSNNRWDDGGALWDTLFWDGRTLAPTTGLDIRGESENIGFLIRKNSDYFSPVRLTGIHYRYINRRHQR